MLPYCIIGKTKSINLDYGRAQEEWKNLTCPRLKRHSEHIVQYTHVYWHKMSKRFTDKRLMNEHISKHTIYDATLHGADQ